DLVLKNGKIVDGTGAPWYIADIAIQDGKIVRIGRIKGSEGKRSIDLTGLYVAPGFIDLMGQTATPMLEDPTAALNLLTQGITTINAGEGHSAAPVSADDAHRTGWQTLGEYFLLLEQRGLPVNVAQTVGHTQVRQLVIGDVDRRPTNEELKRMKDLVRQAMRDGAIGVSTALIYPPAVYATTEEIAALASVSGEYGGRYYTHMRNEGDRLLEAIDEALEIGRTAGTPVHIFHLKSAGRQNWGKIDQAIARIRAARADGQQVTADIYPYVNNGLGLDAFIHPRHFAEGRGRLRQSLDDPDVRADIRREMQTGTGWENWYRHVGSDWNNVVIGSISDPEYKPHEGQTLAAIAQATNHDPWDVFFTLAKSGAFALPHSMSEANKIKLIQQEFISFCTDVGPAGESRIASHPRAWGSFPRLLGHYVRDLGAISLEQAIAQAASVAANELMAFDRGRIAPGLAADIVVFDYDRLTDRATLADPDRPSEGMVYVLVNGEIVLEDGKYTGRNPGVVLRGPGYRSEDAPHRIRTGDHVPGMEPFDRLMRSFIAEHSIPGAALAVTDQGRLVYARGYGYADMAARRPVSPASLFRIASISKPITAVAVLQLVEQNTLKLDDRVFDVLRYEPHLTQGETFDERHNQITIRQLLQHTGGWDRDESFDPMFQSVRIAEAWGTTPPAEPQHIIRFMLGRRLDFDPGARYAYSNFGYCLLGRIIEKTSGQPYEQYVREHVLKPLGIETMRLGRTECCKDRDSNEVKYYDPGYGRSVLNGNLGERVSQPYGAWYLEAMDAHGGWVASAVDLARFAAAFDGPENCPILSAESVRMMFSRPDGSAGYMEDGTPKDAWYGLGWSVRQVADGGINTWHTGSLPGTATILVRGHDGRNWVVLFNSRESRHAEHLTRAIDPLLHQAADEVRDWPNVDLFDE
ncbi:MAG: serine hydrolase, partial [Planctomycetaceae bacterium]